LITFPALPAGVKIAPAVAGLQNGKLLLLYFVGTDVRQALVDIHGCCTGFVCAGETVGTRVRASQSARNSGEAAGPELARARRRNAETSSIRAIPRGAFLRTIFNNAIGSPFPLSIDRSHLDAHLRHACYTFHAPVTNPDKPVADGPACGDRVSRI